MEYLKIFTYWFVAINIVVTLVFDLICIIYGARDLSALLRSLRVAEVDDSDDGRVVHEDGDCSGDSSGGAV